MSIFAASLNSSEQLLHLSTNRLMIFNRNSFLLVLTVFFRFLFFIFGGALGIGLKTSYYAKQIKADFLLSLAAF